MFASRCKDVKNSVIEGPAQMQAKLAAMKAELDRAKHSQKKTASKRGGAGAGVSPLKRRPSYS